MPYITISTPSGIAIGKTVGAKIDTAPGRVTLLDERTLRIEPDDVWTILTATSENGRTTICAIGRGRRAS